MAKKEKEDANLAPEQQKMKALQAAMEKIEKSFGKGAIMKMGEDKVENIDVIPSGSIGLNMALGVGGYPKGRIIEIFGHESSGKTTLAIHAIAECQKAGGVALSSMQSTRLTASMLRIWAWTSTIFSSASQTMVSRHWRSQTSSSVRALWTSS